LVRLLLVALDLFQRLPSRFFSFPWLCPTSWRIWLKGFQLDLSLSSKSSICWFFWIFWWATSLHQNRAITTWSLWGAPFIWVAEPHCDLICLLTKSGGMVGRCWWPYRSLGQFALMSTKALKLNGFYQKWAVLPVEPTPILWLGCLQNLF